MANHTVITLSREYCTGGRQIAQAVADKLGIPCYDKELITIAAKQSGLSEAAIAASEKRRTGSLLYSLYSMGGDLPLADQVYILQSNIIKKLAQEGPCVILGRCGDYVLRDRPYTLKVFVHGDHDSRHEFAKTWGPTMNLDERGVDIMLEKEDRRRAGYYNYYTENRWGDVHNYDLVLNSRLGLDACADLVLQAYSHMEALKK